MKRSNIKIVVAVIIGSVLLIFGPILFNMLRLDYLAGRNKSALGKIVILEDKKATISAAPNGDGLTGYDSPASEEFAVNNSVKNLHAQVTRNLQSQGFTVSTSFSWSGEGNTSISQLNGYAIKGDRGLLLRYVLRDVFSCSGTAVQLQACPSDVVARSNLQDSVATTLLVTYERAQDVTGYGFGP